MLPLEGTYETVLVVAHGALNRSILNAVLDIPVSDFWHFRMGNCATAILECRDGKIYMRVAAGSVQNLKPELVTEAFVRYLGMDAEEVTFTHHRLEIFAESENMEGKMILVPLDALGTEIV